jgi:hypothetical protein
VEVVDANEELVAVVGVVEVDVLRAAERVRRAGDPGVDRRIVDGLVAADEVSVEARVGSCDCGGGF